jgi:hypothetical protein
MIVYQVVDDREGLNEVIATYDNKERAEAHRKELAATDDMYGDYFLVNPQRVSSEMESQP